MPAVQAPADILREVFGYASFRGQQQDIIEHVTGGGDALVLMPTGGGKSLYSVLPHREPIVSGASVAETDAGWKVGAVPPGVNGPR